MIDYSTVDLYDEEFQPTITTITGDAGVGKTLLAGTWPKPIFIRVEDGFKVFDQLPKEQRPAKLPVVSSVADLMDQLKWILKGEHDFKTLVIDSVTQADLLFTAHVIETDEKGANSLATANGGYGGGYSAVAALHGRIRQAAKMIAEQRKMHIVFIAHSDVDKIDLPDSEPFSRYELALHAKSAPHYVNNVDMVAYIRLETFIKKSKELGAKAKAVSDGRRIAICHTDAAQISKNRFGIEEPVQIEKGKCPFNFIK